MSLIIFGDAFSFPDGNAATNRVFTYAKGFVENGVNTSVICFCNEYESERDGTIEGINYYHPSKCGKRVNNFIQRNCYKIIKYIYTIRLISKIDSKDKISAIIIYTKDSLTYIYSFFIAKIFNLKLIIENSEHPLRYYQSGFKKRIIGYLKLKIELLTLDGILLITQQLIDFYSAKLTDSTKLFLVPSTVDPSRFKYRASKTPYEYIGYFGSINFSRDNVDLLIYAFAQIAEKHKEIHLLLGGICLDNDRKLLFNLIQSLNIESRVHVLNYLEREEITKYIAGSKILVLVRSYDYFTEASYPSKLTEYLATGNPVVSVKVSEIARYLIDNVNAFLIDPGDIIALAGKFEMILNNYETAKMIGVEGQQLTYSVFNYKYQASRIMNFINSL